MRKKFVIPFIVLTLLLFLFPYGSPEKSLLSVFRVTEQPDAIVSGSYGSALTVNISFGGYEVEKWIRELEKPYPLLLIDTEWASRFPETVKLIKKKNIPIGLLGSSGEQYLQDAELLLGQIGKFEELFGTKPLWFRTSDEFFPIQLRQMLWEVEMNALASSVQWKGGKLPPAKKGEIISVPLHRDVSVSFQDLDRLMKSRQLYSIEDVLFGTSVKRNKLPK